MSRLLKFQKDNIVDVLLIKAFVETYNKCNEDSPLLIGGATRYLRITAYKGPFVNLNSFLRYGVSCEDIRHILPTVPKSQTVLLETFSRLNFYDSVCSKSLPGAFGAYFLVHLYYSILFSELLKLFIETENLTTKPKLIKLIKLSHEEVYKRAREIALVNPSKIPQRFGIKTILERNPTYTDFIEEAKSHGK